MTIDDVLKYFGSKAKACKAIDLDRRNFTNWIKRGYIPPVTQLKLQKASNNKLKADFDTSIRKGNNDD